MYAPSPRLQAARGAANANGITDWVWCEAPGYVLTDDALKMTLRKLLELSEGLRLF